MDGRLLLIDTDLFILLSAAGLIDQVAAQLGVAINQVRRLSALPHMLRKPGRSMRRKYPQDFLDQALTDCDRIPGLTERPASDETFDRLLRPHDDIDEGEAFLYATVCEQDCMLLGSGDKRAMVALAEADDLADIRAKVAGRIISLEVVCELLLRTCEIHFVTESLAPLAPINQTLRVLFGSGSPYTTEDRLEAVASYRRDLEQTVGEDFLYRVEGDD